MNLRDLKYLVALADHRHFGRAAEACFASQPTLSVQIRKLEEELGVTLFERMTRGVLLTRAGEAIVARARAVLREVDAIRDIARRAGDPESGSIRLGIFPTLGPYLLPHIVPALHRRYPRLEMLLIEEKTEELLGRLERGEIDTAMLALPVPAEGLVVEPLFEEPFVLALPSERADQFMTTVRMEELRDQQLLLLEEGHCLRDQALALCERAGVEEKVGFRATSLETLRQMVAANVGITLLPKLAVLPPVAPNEHIALRDFAPPSPKRRIAMLWRKSDARTELMIGLAAETRRVARRVLAAEALAAKDSRYG